ncbi:hypothetical protein ACWGE0_12950 [Lentzea sp. NPDC054927]
MSFTQPSIQIWVLLQRTVQLAFAPPRSGFLTAPHEAKIDTGSPASDATLANAGVVPIAMTANEAASHKFFDAGYTWIASDAFAVTTASGCRLPAWTHDVPPFQ